MNQYIKALKSYKYTHTYLDYNNQIANIKSQLKVLKAEINIKVLEQWESLLKEETLPYCLLVKNDISTYAYEYKKAINELEKKLYYLSKGSSGEDVVSQVVHNFDTEWMYLENIRLEVESNKIENDFIIIHKSGLYTVEVKNIGNRSQRLIIDNYGRLTRYDERNKILEQSDLLNQSNRHLAFIKKLLNKNNLNEIPVQQLIVITSPIKVKNDSDIPILGPNILYSYISSQSVAKSMDSCNQEKIRKILLDNSISLESYPIIQYDKMLIHNYKLILLAITELKEYKKSLC